ncbi:lasso peptide biosynthesis B2 protein [Caulobacter segnis]|uniref:Lasso peptide biosynthesis B2 protein n=1 Tax=Caulobacter segnis TaxID=88688 RepID=A0A2W5WJV7_9CAUL|nr:lasso peptide biosynthesis B2 protein [Caulobacter segnis]PZR34098.1 MAG: lasso peptide biosynthesis B2 protein [Caulobacter segnis]
MSLRLADHVHGVTIDGDLVLLDASADAYFCLPNVPGIAVAADGRVAGAPGGLADSLVEAGLAETSPPRRARRAPVGVARTARHLIRAEHQAASPGTPRRWRAIIGAVIDARRGRRRPFLDLVRSPRPRVETLSPALLDDLRAYRRLTPWLPVDGACLFRSHMLRSYLRALGHDADWVFGVSVWPFRAHCWLQVGDVALDDEAERLAGYRPILVA